MFLFMDTKEVAIERETDMMSVLMQFAGKNEHYGEIVHRWALWRDCA